MRLRMAMLWAAWPVANAAVILAKGHIHDPVVGVFDGPVLSHRLQHGPGSGGQAGNEDTDVGRDPVAAAAFALNPDQTGQVAPFTVGVNMGERGVAVTQQRRISMRLCPFPTVSA